MPPEQTSIGPDGVARTLAEQRRINLLVVGVLGGGKGKDLLDYLRSFTLDAVAGPEITDSALRHREGMRYVVGILSQRIALGHKELTNERSRQTAARRPVQRRKIP